MTKRVLRLLPALLCWLAWGAAPASALSDEKAVAAMSAVYERALKVSSFESEIRLVREDPSFLAGYGLSSSDPDVPGILNFDSPNRQYNLYLRKDGDAYLHFVSKGLTVAPMGQVRIPTAQPDPSPASGSAPVGLAPRSREPVPFHPLLFLWPYVMHEPDVRNQYHLVSERETVAGRLCYQIEVRSSVSQHVLTLWVDPSTEQIVQVEVSEPGGQQVTATYTEFRPPDKDTGYALSTRVDVQVGGRPAYSAEFTKPQINPDRIVAAQGSLAGPVKTSNSRRTARKSSMGSVPPIISGALWVLVSLLGIALAVLGWRFVRFAASRQEFAEELVVIDDEEAAFTRLLEGLGYTCVPFSAEILSQERLLLGKGATADTTRKPRGVVVAPEAAGVVKGFFFLLKAYVEEGGRVLVMAHSPRSSAAMPFTASFVPMLPDDSATVYHCRSGVLTALPEEEVAKLCRALAGRELYTQVNERPVTQEIVTGRNKNTGVKGSVLGVVRQGKGEFVLCQLRFDPRLTASSATIRRLLDDLIHLLQAHTVRRSTKERKTVP